LPNDVLRLPGGGIAADYGDVLINSMSIVENANRARVALGLCPQFTAIDNQLTVREHLSIYSRLKGVPGDKRVGDVQTLLRMTVRAFDNL
jgi:ATP-binding cassette subfamily A (ABC1) protein 3